MDFLDWISDGVDYIGDLFTEAGEGATEALSKLFVVDTPDMPESPVMEPAPTPEPSQITEEAAANAFKESGGNIEAFGKWIEGLGPEGKKQFEALINNKLMMGGLAGGASAMLKTRAQDKMLEAQKNQQDDQQQFRTEELERRGSAPKAVAKVRPRGLTEGYLRG